MVIQKVNLGAPVTGEGGDKYREAHRKINDNFDGLIAAIDKPQLYFEGEIIVDTVLATVTYPKGVAVISSSAPVFFASATLVLSTANITTLHYFDVLTNSFGELTKLSAIAPLLNNIVKVGTCYKGIFSSDYSFTINNSEITDEDKPQLYFEGEIIVDTVLATVTYPKGVVIEKSKTPLYFLPATLDLSTTGSTRLNYFDLTTGAFAELRGTAAYQKADKYKIIVGASYLRTFNSTFSFEIKKGADETPITPESNADGVKSNLDRLYDDLHNPLMSVNVRLVGDSITWGVGATGTSDGTPRTGTLIDPRNTTDATISPTWANLLSRYLAKTFTDGELVHEPMGKVYAKSKKVVIFSKDADYFSFGNPSKEIELTKEQLRLEVTKYPMIGGEYIDLSRSNNTTGRPSEFSFVTNGDGFKLYYTGIKNGTAQTYFMNIYVDDVFHQKVSVYADTLTIDSNVFISLPNNGRHKITIKNESTVVALTRVQCIEIEKKVAVINDGNTGSTTYSWLTAVKLSESIKPYDDYVFVQLGTNDRIRNSRNSPQLLAHNLRTIVSDIQTLSYNNARTILMSASAVTQNENPDTSNYQMTAGTVNTVVKNIADEMRVPFISNYESTKQLELDGVLFLSDNLHPNDFGHREIFKNIKKSIIGI